MLVELLFVITLGPQKTPYASWSHFIRLPESIMSIHLLLKDFKPQFQRGGFLSLGLSVVGPTVQVSFLLDGVPHHVAGAWQQSKKLAQRDTAERCLG